MKHTLLKLAAILGVFLGSFGLTYASTIIPYYLGGTGNYAAGYIPFGTGAYSYAATSTNLFWDNTNSRLGIASATPTYTLSIGTLAPAFYITSAGEVVGYDTLSSKAGQITPTRYIAFKLSTTTAWTSSTSQPYDADVVAPFTGSANTIACSTDAGTLTMEGTNASTHVYIAGASTTANTNTFSLAFAKGDKLNFIAGNPASSPTWISCTLGATQTP